MNIEIHHTVNFAQAQISEGNATITISLLDDAERRAMAADFINAAVDVLRTPQDDELLDELYKIQELL